jgi:25S rRNA (uracil2634-N3)-methyltransferase
LTTESILITPPLLITTSYDSEATCFNKYPEAKDIVDRVRALGATVFFDVDATKLGKHKQLRKLVYDTVAFNFPHVGKLSERLWGAT